jgi:methyl-accepting chemotaxis protein PixJ
MATQIRQASDQDTLVKITTAQVREKIACDRALIYRFDSSDYGVVLAESKTVGWTPASREKLPAVIFGLAASRDYLAEEFVAIEDTNKIEITPYQLQLLEKFQIKASLSIPILLKGEILGLLVVQNCLAPRQWQEVEISLLSQITT